MENHARALAALGVVRAVAADVPGAVVMAGAGAVVITAAVASHP